MVGVKLGALRNTVADPENHAESLFVLTVAWYQEEELPRYRFADPKSHVASFVCMFIAL